MKKFYMTMVAMLCGAAAMAQTCVLSAEDVTLVPGGEEATLTFILTFTDLAEDNQPTGAVVGFKLPAGVSIPQTWDEDEESWVYDFESPMSKPKSHKPSIEKGATDNEGWTGYAFSAVSTGATFKTSSNVLAIIPIVAAADAVEGEYEITLRPSYAKAGASVFPQEPFTIKMTVGDPTGINSINADDVNAPVYNVAGQRVSKAQKGVYIQNGKKVAVK